MYFLYLITVSDKKGDFAKDIKSLADKFNEIKDKNKKEKN